MDTKNFEERQRLQLTKEERAAKKAAAQAEGEIAIAEHEKREAEKRANMERLKAARLLRDGTPPSVRNDDTTR